MKRHNDLPISEVLKQWTQTSKFKPSLIQQKLETEWVNWVGKTVAKHTEKISVRGQKLYIQIKSSTLKYEMNLGRERLLNLIHQKLGENYFDEIIFN
ncbi:MAG: DUF721 domain-containing protein [Saprospiraceae bacterium]